MTDQPTTRNPFALLHAYVAAALFPDRPARPARKPGRRRAVGRHRPGDVATYRTPAPVVVPEPPSPPGDTDHNREE